MSLTFAAGPVGTDNWTGLSWPRWEHMWATLDVPSLGDDAFALLPLARIDSNDCDDPIDGDDLTMLCHALLNLARRTRDDAARDGWTRLYAVASHGFTTGHPLRWC